MRTVRIGPFTKGMNNRARDGALPESIFGNTTIRDTARNLVNMNIDAQGIGKKRVGMTKVYSGVRPRGGFDCPSGTFFVEAGALKQFNDDYTATILYTGLTGSYQAFHYFNDVVYFSDGVANLKITGGVAAKWGIPPPVAPLVSRVAGTYGAGKYLVAYVWVDSNGVESGASYVVSIDVLDDSGFTFHDLPLSSDPQVSTLRIYLSTANGSAMYHVADTNSSSYTITAGRYDNSNILEGVGIYPPPPGRIIRTYNARIFIADDYGNLWHSQPYSFDQFRLADAYHSMGDVINVMEPVKSGIFAATDRETYFLAGDVEDGFDVQKKLDYGAVYDTGLPVPNSNNVCWQSQRGLVVGAPDGSCKNLVEENVAVETAKSGATLIMETDGVRIFIASLHSPTVSPMAAKSFVEAEETRRGV